MSKIPNKKHQRIVHKIASKAEAEANHYIEAGWRVVHLASASTGGNVYLTFILER